MTIGTHRVTRMDVIQDIALLGRLGMPAAFAAHALREVVPTLTKQQSIEIVEDIQRLNNVAQDFATALKATGKTIR